MAKTKKRSSKKRAPLKDRLACFALFGIITWIFAFGIGGGTWISAAVATGIVSFLFYLCEPHTEEQRKAMEGKKSHKEFGNEFDFEELSTLKKDPVGNDTNGTVAGSTMYYSVRRYWDRNNLS